MRQLQFGLILLFLSTCCAMAEAVQLAAAPIEKSYTSSTKKSQPVNVKKPIGRFPVDRIPPITVSKPGCKVKQLTVNKQVAGKAGEGVHKSIEDALAHAARKKFCAVKVKVQAGEYPGRLSITRSTVIEGTSSRSVKITGSISNGKGHALTLKKISIVGAKPYGLIQRGGSLVLEQVRISNTGRASSDAHSGVALDLGGGVRGILSTVNLDSNKGTALRVEGNRTKVRAFNLVVRNNEIHPLALKKNIQQDSLDRISAIDVSGAATLLVDRFSIIGNDFVGILVRDRAKAHFKNGHVKNTSKKRQGSRTYAGFNIWVKQQGTLEIDHWETMGANVGINIDHGWIQATAGNIHHNRMGININGSPDRVFDARQCIETISPDVVYDWCGEFVGPNLDLVTYECPPEQRQGQSAERAIDTGRNVIYDNEIPFRTSSHPVPCGGPALPCSRTACPSVPWSF